MTGSLVRPGKPPLAADPPAVYAIRTRGSPGPAWRERLRGMHVAVVWTTARPTTEFIGSFADRTELAGVLTALTELGLMLLSVERLPEGASGARVQVMAQA
jgi:hypothetical protein